MSSPCYNSNTARKLQNVLKLPVDPDLQFGGVVGAVTVDSFVSKLFHDTELGGTGKVFCEVPQYKRWVLQFLQVKFILDGTVQNRRARVFFGDLNSVDYSHCVHVYDSEMHASEWSVIFGHMGSGVALDFVTAPVDTVYFDLNNIELDYPCGVGAVHTNFTAGDRVDMVLGYREYDV